MPAGTPAKVTGCGCYRLLVDLLGSRQALANDYSLTRGMTREQVLMAVGYPVSSENPSLVARIWRFWRDSFNEFQVHFDDQGRVKEISTDPMTRNLLVKE